MTTRQAEEILRHTFKQLEKMLNDERKKKIVDNKSSTTNRQSNKNQEKNRTMGKTGDTESNTS